MRTVAVVVPSVAALAAVSVWLTACPARFNGTACGQICPMLQTCGFLPSSLGADLTSVDAVDNCTSRCEESNGDVVQSIYSCTSQVDNDGDGGPPPCTTPCGAVAQCLLSQFPKDGVLGQAAVTVVSVLATPAAGGDGGAEEDSGALWCGPPPCPSDASVCPTATGLAFVGDRGSSWCDVEFASSARAFVFQNGTYSFSSATGCPDLLAHPPTFTSLEPGPALVGLEVRGTPTLPSDAGNDSGSAPVADASLPPFCHQYYGDHIALLSGQAPTALVPLPAEAGVVLDCEEGFSLCHDNHDNDLNGLTDCSDPRCAPVCVDAGVVASGDGGSADAAPPPEASVAQDAGAGDAPSPVEAGADAGQD